MFKKITTFTILSMLILGLFILVGCTNTNSSDVPPAPNKAEETKKAKLPDTMVPSDSTPEKYLEKYYKAYLARKFKESYKMLPAGKKESQSFEEYESAHKSLPAKSFKLGTKKEQGNFVVLDVKLEFEKFGTWNVSWQFEKKGKEFIVSDYAASDASGGSGSTGGTGGGSSGGTGSGSSPH